MKPTSRNQDLVVICYDKEQTNFVLNYYDDDKDDYEHSYCNFIIYLKREDNLVTGIFGSKKYVKENYPNTPIIHFEEWLELPHKEPSRRIVTENGFTSIFDNSEIKPKLETNLPYFMATPKGLRWDDDKKAYEEEKLKSNLPDFFYNEKGLYWNEESKEYEEPLGFVLEKEEYIKAVGSIMIINNIDWWVGDNFGNNKEKYGCNILNCEKEVLNDIKKAGVLDLWFGPVFDKNEIQEELNDFKREFSLFNFQDLKTETFIKIKKYFNDKLK